MLTAMPQFVDTVHGPCPKAVWLQRSALELLHAVYWASIPWVSPYQQCLSWEITRCCTLHSSYIPRECRYVHS
jgi:hypothetical protein